MKKEEIRHLAEKLEDLKIGLHYWEPRREYSLQCGELCAALEEQASKVARRLGELTRVASLQ